MCVPSICRCASMCPCIVVFHRHSSLAWATTLCMDPILSSHFRSAPNVNSFCPDAFYHHISPPYSAIWLDLIVYLCGLYLAVQSSCPAPRLLDNCGIPPILWPESPNSAPGHLSVLPTPTQHEISPQLYRAPQKGTTNCLQSTLLLRGHPRVSLPFLFPSDLLAMCEDTFQPSL